MKTFKSRIITKFQHLTSSAIILLATLFLIISCSKADSGIMEENNGFVIKAILDTSVFSTKTQHVFGNNKLKTSWLNGDEIAFAGNNTPTYKLIQKGSILNDGHAANFVCDETADLPKGEVVAVYPYSPDFSFSINTQTGKLSDLNKSDILLARSNIEEKSNVISLNFSPLCAIIRLPKNLRVSAETNQGSINLVFKGINVASGLTVSKSGGITKNIGKISVPATIINGQLTEDLYIAFIPINLSGLHLYTLESDKGDYHELYREGIATAKIYSINDLSNGIIVFNTNNASGEKLKEYCLTNFDYNKDGEISYAEAKAVRRIDFDKEMLTDEINLLRLFFTNIRFLKIKANLNNSINFSYNKMIDTLILEAYHCYSLSLTDNTNLSYLDIRRATCLTSLDLRNCEKLTHLSIDSYGNPNGDLKSLNISNNVILKYLSIRGMNKMELPDLNNYDLRYLNISGYSGSLDISNNNLLDTLILEASIPQLDISNNLELKYYYYKPKNKESSNPKDFSKHKKLEYLNCENNNLSELNVYGCTSLKFLNCASNKLSSLDITGCLDLRSLRCPNNKISTLDVSKFNALDTLICNNNSLTSLDARECPYLKLIDCFNNSNLSELYVNGCINLDKLECWNNSLTQLDLVGAGGSKLLVYLTGYQDNGYGIYLEYPFSYKTISHSMNKSIVWKGRYVTFNGDPFLKAKNEYPDQWSGWYKKTDEGLGIITYYKP